MQRITISKNNFLKGRSTFKDVTDGGYGVNTTGVETSRYLSNLGRLVQGRLLDDLSDNVADNILASTQANYSGGALRYLAIGDAGKIYQIAAALSLTTTVLATESNNTYDTNSDVLVYKDKAYYTATTDIAQSSITGTSLDHDWWTNTKSKSALTAGVKHKMITFFDTMYITNGNVLASWNGATAVDAALTLPENWVITDVVIFQNQLYISASYYVDDTTYNTDTKIFVWDGANPASTTWQQEIDIDTATIGSMRVVNQNLYFFAARSLYLLVGYQAKLVKNIGTSTMPNWKQLGVYGSTLYFATSTGIHGYDTRFDALSNPIYTTDTINNFFIGLNDTFAIATPTNKLYRATSNSGVTNSIFYSNVIDFNQPVFIRRVEILFADALVSGADYDISILDEKDTVVYTEDITYADDGAIVKFSDNKMKAVSVDSMEFKLVNNNGANSPIVAIHIYYESTSRRESK